MNEELNDKKGTHPKNIIILIISIFFACFGFAGALLSFLKGLNVGILNIPHSIKRSLLIKAI